MLHATSLRLILYAELLLYSSGCACAHWGSLRLLLPLDLARLENDVPHEGLEHLGGYADVALQEVAEVCERRHATTSFSLTLFTFGRRPARWSSWSCLVRSSFTRDPYVCFVGYDDDFQ